MEVCSDRTYHLPLPRDEIWRRLAVVDDYSSWWPWLRRFDAEALAAGQIWRAVLKTNLAYAIRCEVRLVTVTEPGLVIAALSGDLVGKARIELEEEGARTGARVCSELRATSRAIRVVASAAPKLVRRTHDWLLDTAAHQFSAAHAAEADHRGAGLCLRSGGVSRH